MTLPRQYRKVGEPIIASYDFSELATGEVYITFYPFDGTNLAMSTNSLIEGSGGFINEVGSGTTRDFEIEFSRPITIDGKAIISLSWAQRNTFGATQDVTNTFQPSLRKIDIASAESELLSGARMVYGGGLANNTTRNKIFTWDGDVARTHFAIGEKLVLRVFASGASAQGTTQQAFGTDPADRTTLITDWTNGARSQIFIPYRTQL
jgi:hypothetical protein